MPDKNQPSPSEILAKKYFDQAETLFGSGGNTPDYAKAAELYRKSANLGYTPAVYSLGVCYLRGMGVKRDEKRAYELITEAAEQGNLDAEFTLGHFYFEGSVVECDYEKAARIFKKAADLNHPGGLNDLGFCYQRGHGRLSVLPPGSFPLQGGIP